MVGEGADILPCAIIAVHETLVFSIVRALFMKLQHAALDPLKLLAKNGNQLVLSARHLNKCFYRVMAALLYCFVNKTAQFL